MPLTRDASHCIGIFVVNRYALSPWQMTASGSAWLRWKRSRPADVGVGIPDGLRLRVQQETETAWISRHTVRARRNAEASPCRELDTVERYCRADDGIGILARR